MTHRMVSVPKNGDVVAKRRNVLAALSTPTTKPELVDELDASRSTVDRSVDALLEHGYVERRGSEYVATYAGRAAADAYDSFLTRLDSLAAAQPVLSVLPPDVDIPPAVFDGATVHRSTPAAPDRPVEQSLELVADATTFRGTAPAILSRYLDIFETLADTGTDLELVLTQQVVETLRETYPDGLDGLESQPAIALYVTTDRLPYAVWTAERPERTRSGLIAYGDNGLAGIISNDTAAMNEWANERYARVRADARRLD